MIQLKNVRFSYAGEELLKEISFSVKKGECVCLIGPNGSGKTTLLKCITGELKTSSGIVLVNKDVKIGYLKQETSIQDLLVIDYLFSNFGELSNIKAKLDSDVSDPFVYSDLVSRYAELGGYELEVEIKRIVTAFGFNKGVLEKKIEELSQGQKRLIELIRLKFENHALYILDEPTNHLDISARLRFEEFIREEKGKGNSFLIVSHDRAMIDKVADKTVYIQRGVSVKVKGGYSDILKHLELNFKSRKRRSGEIQRKIHELEKEITRIKHSSNAVEHKESKKQTDKKSKAYLGKKSQKLMKRSVVLRKRVERMNDKFKEEKPFVEKKLNLSFEGYIVSNRLLFRAKKLYKFFNAIAVLRGLNLQVETKDRIGIIGSSGCGKTTLLRCLVGELGVDGGEIYRNDSVKYLYMPQDIRQLFKRKTLIENMSSDRDAIYVRQVLGAAKIRKEKALQSIETLSYGELTRVAFVYAIINKVEFLVMDEPTTHLDIESLEMLDQLLKEFPGGMMFVSHDRAFIAQNAQKLLKLENGYLELILVKR